MQHAYSQAWVSMLSALHVHARSLCESSLRAYTPLDLDTPGLTLLHLDPPIFTVDSFMSPEECADLISAAEATGAAHAMDQSSRASYTLEAMFVSRSGCL